MSENTHKKHHGDIIDYYRQRSEETLSTVAKEGECCYAKISQVCCMFVA